MKNFTWLLRQLNNKTFLKFILGALVVGAIINLIQPATAIMLVIITNPITWWVIGVLLLLKLLYLAIYSAVRDATRD